MAPVVGILSPGDMGHAVGNVLRHHGLRVVTCLQGRSPRSAALAAQAGIVDLPDDDTLVREASLILSIVAPAGARSVGQRVAEAARRTGARPTFVDCNAVSPGTVTEIAASLAAAGVPAVDAGILGGPPKIGAAGPRLYASGESAATVLALNEFGLDVRLVGPKIGQASGLKMCYAALTKGLTALLTELLVAGRALDLEAPLHAELASSLRGQFAWAERQVPGMPPKAYRWVAEMEEIAATFEAVGLTPRILLGAADMYRFVGETPLGAETPENRTAGQTLAAVIDTLAAALPAKVAAPAD